MGNNDVICLHAGILKQRAVSKRVFIFPYLFMSSCLYYIRTVHFFFLFPQLDACVEQLLFCGSTRGSVEGEEEMSEKKYGEIPFEPALPHPAFRVKKEREK